jgi:glutamyl-tRNA synthetase
VELQTDMAALIEGFDISRFGSAPTKFDVADLYPLTARYLGGLPLEAVADEIAAAGVPDDKAAAFWAVTRENITTLKDLPGWWALMRDGAEPLVDEADREFVAEAMTLLPEGPFGPETWSEWTAAVKEKTGRKGRGLFMPLRRALTGQDHGPEMAALMPLLQVVKARG